MHHPSADSSMVSGAATAEAPVSGKTWMKRLGAAAFLFFLIKGLLWLAIPAGLVAWRWWGSWGG